MQATWKEGRPLVDRVKTLHLFHVRTGPEQIDLIRTLEERGYTATLNSDGSIDCLKKPASQAGGTAAAPVYASGPHFKTDGNFRPDEATRTEIEGLLGRFVSAVAGRQSAAATACCDFEVNVGVVGVRAPASVQVSRAIGFWSNRTISLNGLDYFMNGSTRMCQATFNVAERPGNPVVVNVVNLGGRWKISAINIGDR